MINLREVFQFLKDKYPVELVAGEDGLRQRITWFHLIENIEQSIFIRGNELVFTTGMSSDGDEWLYTFTSRLMNNKASGLAVNLGPYIGRIPDKVIEMCNRSSFPLFSIPWHVKLVDITRDLSQFVLEAEKTEFEIGQTLKKALAEGLTADALAVLEEHDIGARTPCCVAVAAVDSRLQPAALEMVQFQLSFGGMRTAAFCHQGNLITVFFSSAGDQAAALLLSAAKKSIALLCFGMGTAPTLAQLPRAYEEAIQAGKIARLNSVPLERYDRLGTDKVLLAVENEPLLRTYVREVLGDILDYDAAHNTDYIRWLELYLQYDGSVQKIAGHMYCHRNTVNYRLRRLNELLGTGLRSNEQRFKAMLALRIRTILNLQD